MKPKKLKSLLILLFLLPLSITILGTGCEKDEPEEEQGFSTRFPGFAIYKTNGDYFNLVDIGMRDGSIVRTPTFIYGYKLEIEGDRITYKNRLKLDEGYILDKEASSNDAFLDITIAEYYQWEVDNETSGMSHELMEQHILDEAPYIELWYTKEDIEKDELTRSEINELIKNNNLSLYFEKLK